MDVDDTEPQLDNPELIQWSPRRGLSVGEDSTATEKSCGKK